MFQTIEITKEYALAVLLTILPFISDYSAKLGLPVHTPITTNDVAGFTCSRFKDDTGGFVQLKNGYYFIFSKGCVQGYRTACCYRYLQDPKEIPKYYGKVNISREDAIRRAREAIQKLGYNLRETFTDQEPKVDLPEQDGTNVISHYNLSWPDPLDTTPSMDIEMSGIDGTIDYMMSFSTLYWRDQPTVPGFSQPDPLRERLPEIADTNHWLGEILEQGAAYAKAVGLPLPSTLDKTMADRFVYLGSTRDIEVRLTNGYWLQFVQGNIHGFSAPDSYFKRHREEKRPPIEVFLDQWNMSTNEALALGRATARKVAPDLHAVRLDGPPEETARAMSVGRYVIPRYFFRWTSRATNNRSIVAVDVQVEVDASTKTVKYLHVWDGYPKNESPQIDIFKDFTKPL